MGQKVLAQQPTSLQDAWTQTISTSYMHPLNEKVMVMPNFNFTRMIFTSGGNTGREDYLTSVGVNFSYAFADWLNFSTVSNYTWKKTDSTGIALACLNTKISLVWGCIWHKLCLLNGVFFFILCILVGCFFCQSKLFFSFPLQFPSTRTS